MITKITKKIIDKKLDKNIKSSIINTYFKSIVFFKYFSKSISKKLSFKAKSSLHFFNGNFLKGNAMKSNQKNIWEKTMWYFLGIAIIAAALTGCGGGSAGAPTGPTPQAGGGSGTDTVVITTPTVVVTPVIYIAATSCASGPALTSTVSQAAANALVPDSCPTVSTVGVGVSIGAGNMLAITGLPVGVTVSSSTVTMVSGGSTLIFVNGVLTSGTPLSNATYTFSGAVIKLANAPAITIAGTTVSPVIAAVPVVCVAPAMRNSLINQCITAPAATGYTWNSVVAGGVWVANRGVYVIGVNTLPATCLNIGDTCYLAKSADGTIKFVQGPTSVMFAVYQTADGYLNTKPLNNDGTLNNVGPLLISGGASGNSWDYVTGTTNGIVQKVTSLATCSEYTFGTLWSNSSVTCPVGP